MSTRYSSNMEVPSASVLSWCTTLLILSLFVHDTFASKSCPGCKEKREAEDAGIGYSKKIPLVSVDDTEDGHSRPFPAIKASGNNHAELDPCEPSPCGNSGECRVIDGRALCVCPQAGDSAGIQCPPQCQRDSDCSVNKSCERGVCEDPCPRKCGRHIPCEVVDHVAWCLCPPVSNRDCLRDCKESLNRATTEPEENDAQLNRKNKVLFIGIDGLYITQFRKLCSPLEDVHIFQAEVGGYPDVPSTHQETVTKSGWTTVMTGSWANRHGIYRNEEVDPSKVPTLVTYLSDLGHTLAMAHSWEGIRLIFSYTEHRHWHHYQRSVPEKENAEFAKRHIHSGADAIFLFLGEVDDVGHEYGWSYEYDKQSRTTLERVRNLLYEVKYRESTHNESWLVIVTTDHGREYFQGYSHQFQTRTERTSFIGIRQTAHVRPNAATKVNELYLTSVAPTILFHMGYQQPIPDLESVSLIDHHFDNGTVQHSFSVYDVKILQGAITWRINDDQNLVGETMKVSVKYFWNDVVDLVSQKIYGLLPLGDFEVQLYAPNQFPIYYTASNSITAALRKDADTVIFFCSSGNIFEFSLQSKRHNPDVSHISTHYPGMEPHSMAIKAALNPASHFTVFFLSRRRVLVYDNIQREIMPGFPKAVEDYVQGFFLGDVLASFDDGNHHYIILDDMSYALLDPISPTGCVLKESRLLYREGWYNSDFGTVSASFRLYPDTSMFLYDNGRNCTVFSFGTFEVVFQGNISNYLDISGIFVK